MFQPYKAVKHWKCEQAGSYLSSQSKPKHLLIHVVTMLASPRKPNRNPTDTNPEETKCSSIPANLSVTLYECGGCAQAQCDLKITETDKSNLMLVMSLKDWSVGFQYNMIRQILLFM
jgi:hypothetical protein